MFAVRWVGVALRNIRCSFLRVVNTAKEAEYILVRLGNGFIAPEHLALGRDLSGNTFASLLLSASFANLFPAASSAMASEIDTCFLLYLFFAENPSLVHNTLCSDSTGTNISWDDRMEIMKDEIPLIMMDSDGNGIVDTSFFPSLQQCVLDHLPYLAAAVNRPLQGVVGVRLGRVT